MSTASHSEAATSKRKSNCYTVKEDDGKLFHDERVNLQLLLPSRGLVPAAGLCRKLYPNSWRRVIHSPLATSCLDPALSRSILVFVASMLQLCFCWSSIGFVCSSPSCAHLLSNLATVALHWQPSLCSILSTISSCLRSNAGRKWSKSFFSAQFDNIWRDDVIIFTKSWEIHKNDAEKIKCWW